MRRAWWTDGVGVGLERRAALPARVVADGEVAGDEVDLFPVFVDEGLLGVDAGLEAEEPRAAAALRLLVESAGEDLLLDAGGITRQRLPPRAHVDGVELVMGLGDGHGIL